MENEKIFREMKNAILEGEIELAGELAQKAVEVGMHPLDAIEKGFTPGIDQVGENFERGDMFLPELVAAAEAMKEALAVLEPAMLEKQAKRSILGRVVIGTMLHDIHDIGKDMVASMLTAAGFEVFNLGVNVPAETFVAKVRELKPHILGLSALLTTTMPEQETVIKALEAQGLRQEVKVVVGGAPVNQGWADAIGADGFAENAMEAVKLAKGLVT